MSKETKVYLKVCVNCGKEYETTKRKSQCCSKTCVSQRKGASSRARKGFYSCPICGKDTESRHRKYCSTECLEKSKDIRFIGVDPYAFRGGRKESFGRRVRYHRYVMEQHLGRKLEKSEVVHHVDGNKFNNDISNLKLLTASEHAKLHTSKREKDAFGRYK